MAGFDEATAVTARADGTEFDVVLDEAWSIGNGRAHGGYLLGVLGRAAVAAAGAQPHPVGAHAQYVSSPQIGPAVVETSVLRSGRSASQVRTTLVQDGKPFVYATFTLGTLGTGRPYWGESTPVEITPIERCQPLPSFRSADGKPTMRDSIRLQLDPATFSGFDGNPSGDGELRAWCELVDDQPWDPISLLFAADVMPPATMTVVQTGWVPTLDLSVYVRALPAPGPIRIRFRVGTMKDGFADETCEIWDSNDQLVVLATQLAALRLPEET